MATYSAGVALAFTYEVTDGTTGTFSPSGTNQAIFGQIACGGFSGLPSITSLQYDNSSGTTITRIGSDLTWVGGTGSQAIFGLAPGETGSKALYGDWAATPLQSAVAGISYSGVDQTTPFSGQVDATPTFVGSVTTTVASVTVTGCTAGQTIIAAVSALSDGVVLSAFTAVSGTTLRVSDVTGTFVGVAMLEKVATGSSETLSVNVNASSSNGLYWSARGIRVNDASGGPTYTLTADGGTYSLSGTANVLTAGRTISADSGSFSLSGTAIALTASRVLDAAGGTYSLTGQDATLTYTPVSSYELVADSGAFTYSGTDASLVVSRAIAADSGTYSYAGQNVALTYSGSAPIYIIDGHDGGSEPDKKAPDFRQYKEAKARLRKQIEAAFTSEDHPSEVKEVKAEAEKILAQVVSKRDIAKAMETIKILESALESAQDEEDLLNILL